MYVSRARRSRARLRTLVVVALGTVVLMPRLDLVEAPQLTAFFHAIGIGEARSG